MVLDYLHILLAVVFNDNMYAKLASEKEKTLRATLPFDISKSGISRYYAARILEQTRKRWSWFVRAQELDLDRGMLLGTLGYLPLEIRLQIYKELYDLDFSHSRLLFGLTYRRKLYAYPDRYPTLDSPLLHHYIVCVNKNTVEICRASPTLKSEHEQEILRRLNFGFQCPHALEEFLNQLTQLDQSFLRRVTLVINGSVCWNCSDGYCIHARHNWRFSCRRCNYSD